MDYLDCIACIAIETALPSQSGTITYNFTISGFFRCSGLPKSPRSKCSNLLKKQIGNLWCFWLYCKRKVPADNETTCEWNTRINNSDRVVSVNCKDHEAHKVDCTTVQYENVMNMWKCINVLGFSDFSHHANGFCRDADTSGLGIGSGSVTGTGSGAAPRKFKNHQKSICINCQLCQTKITK